MKRPWTLSHGTAFVLQIVAQHRFWHIVGCTVHFLTFATFHQHWQHSFQKHWLSAHGLTCKALNAMWRRRLTHGIILSCLIYVIIVTLGPSPTIGPNTINTIQPNSILETHTIDDTNVTQVISTTSTLPTAAPQHQPLHTPIPISLPIIQGYDSKVVLCVEKNWAIEGLGNQLNVYWTARAMAYFMKWKFVKNYAVNGTMLCNLSRPMRMFRLTTTLKWTHFLFPELFHDQLMNNSAITSKYNQIYKNSLQRQPHCYVYPHHCTLMSISFNSWFIPVIQNNTRYAFKRFYGSSTSTNKAFYSSWMHDLRNGAVVAIHIRLGDIFFTQQHDRHLLNFEFFRSALDLIFDYDVNHSFFKIKIVSQLSKVNAHNEKDIRASSLSRLIAEFMSQQMRTYITNKHHMISFTLDVIGNDSIDNDVYKLVTAPYVICSISTLCVQASMANFYNPKIIVMPDSSYWGSAPYRKTAEDASFGLLTHHRWISTSKLSALTGSFMKNDTDFNISLFEDWFVGLTGVSS
eukprot:374054_1